MNRIVYVCGGMYNNPCHVPGTTNTLPLVFDLVRPTRDHRPYVAKDEQEGKTLFHLCQHHSHLYSLDLDTGAMALVQSGELGGDRQPPAVLGADLLKVVNARLEEEARPEEAGDRWDGLS